MPRKCYYINKYLLLTKLIKFITNIFIIFMTNILKNGKKVKIDFLNLKYKFKFSLKINNNIRNYYKMFHF
jgi:hypothetical protein